MYDFAERFGRLHTATPVTVCPNTYLIPDALQIHFESAAPFLSKAQRFPKKAADKLPGPGAYDVEVKKHIKGGESVSYRAKRFRYPPPDKVVPIEIPEKPPSVGKLHRGPMPYSLLGRPPSIPPMRGFCGYRCTAYGQLVALKGEVEDPTICRDCCYKCGKAGVRCHCRTEGGRGECFTTLRYKGCFFSHRTSVRQTFQPRPGPGPADYDVEGPGPSQAAIIDERIRQWKRFTAVQLRSTEVVQRRAIRDGFPAPGQYEVHVKEKRKPGKIRGAFLVSSKRFAEPSSRAVWPDPCCYDVRGDLLDRRPGSVASAPFLGLADRFPPPPAYVTPGPGTYELKSTLGAAAVVSRLRSPGAPFDSSAVRKIGYAKPGAEFEPAPDAYELPEEPPIGGGFTSVFKSTTPQTTELKPEERPDCWTYSPRDPNAAPCSHHRGDLSFTARTKRLGRIVDWPSTGVDPGNPGPGAYSQKKPDLCIRAPANSTFGTSDRFPEIKARAPSPDAYTVQQLGWLRQTPDICIVPLLLSSSGMQQGEYWCRTCTDLAFLGVPAADAGCISWSAACAGGRSTRGCRGRRVRSRSRSRARAPSAPRAPARARSRRPARSCPTTPSASSSPSGPPTGSAARCPSTNSSVCKHQ